MAEDILGISAHFDLQDIEGSFKRMCDELTNVGAITEAVSKNMQAAVAGIGLATDEAMREKAVGAPRTALRATLASSSPRALRGCPSGSRFRSASMGVASA